MSTMTWIVRSCFSACWWSLDDHELTSSPQLTVKNMTFVKKKGKSFNSICNNNLSRPSKRCDNPIIKDKDSGGVPIGNKFDHSSWSLSADEDYIVFCFGEDVAQADKGLNGMHRNLRPVNRKLRYSENEEQVGNMHEKISNANQHHNDQECVILYKEVREEERVMVHTGTQQHCDSIRRVCHIEGTQGSAESRNSDQSDGSRSSFAFPILGWEWIGSPVQMPKSKGLHIRKHKARAVRFQCCRF